ncbi:MAG: helix-turn-helix domain-containing protein [Rhizobiales bacterium]|jgi:IclR family mhp operon transcriptional activator|nr:helix-turn-helix domain-containing protein [Hyphomicrobiales bacterium]OJU36064.1 MAG: hypothetical protein BGN94_24300 [Rhizobiales bacterium 68-8]
MRGLERSLDVLAAMNVEPGPHSVVGLSRSTGISRPAIYRILATLAKLGYVTQSPEKDRFQLTSKVRSLSSGYNGDMDFYARAMPRLQELQRRVVWPTNLAVRMDAMMYLALTTRSSSPWVIDRIKVGDHVPMVGSAAGQIYLACAPAPEREALVEELALSEPSPADRRVLRGRIEKAVRLARDAGFGSRYRELVPETGEIAVPIYEGDRVVACLGMTFIASVMNVDEAARKCLPRLLETAADIGLAGA